MKADAAVRARVHVAAVVPPCGDDAVDRARIEVRPVREDDDGRLRVDGKRGEPAAQRRAGAVLPLGAAHGARFGLELVRAGDDEDVVHHALLERREHAGKERLLLRRRGAVARRRAGREDDGVDQLQPARAAQRSSTFAT